MSVAMETLRCTIMCRKMGEQHISAFVLSNSRLVIKKICIFDTGSLEECYEIDSFFIDHTNQY